MTTHGDVTNGFCFTCQEPKLEGVEHKCKDVDFTVQGEGSVYLLQPLTPAAKEWIESHLATQSWQRFGTAIAIEHRYICDIVDGIKADGLAVR